MSTSAHVIRDQTVFVRARPAAQNNLTRATSRQGTFLGPEERKAACRSLLSALAADWPSILEGFRRWGRSPCSAGVLGANPARSRPEADGHASRGNPFSRLRFFVFSRQSWGYFGRKVRNTQGRRLQGVKVSSRS